MLLEKIKTTAKAYPQKLALVNPNFADSNITYAELDVSFRDNVPGKG